MDQQTVATYLARIGVTEPVAADVDTLRLLHERHVLSVPFENLDYHRGVTVEMGQPAIDKIVRDRRGGGCYELNPALGSLLSALGFTVAMMSGRVHYPDRIGAPMCHLMLRVDLDEPWLVDVGFGRNPRRPLQLSSRAVQHDPHGDYQLTDAEGGDIDVIRDGVPLYRIEQRPRTIPEFAPTLWWYRSCPDSTFMKSVFCVLPTETGRISLVDRTVTIIDGEHKSKRELVNDAELLETYRDLFGIDIPTAPAIRLD